MVATGEMSVRLHLRRLRVTRVLVDEIDRLEVEVADTRAVVLCPWCGHKASRVHETRWVVIRDVPLGWPTTLVVAAAATICRGASSWAWSGNGQRGSNSGTESP
ncbi:hypothetical protein BH24ACT7_BH24ACT7_23620 [soil metagenome]